MSKAMEALKAKAAKKVSGGGNAEKGLKTLALTVDLESYEEMKLKFNGHNGASTIENMAIYALDAFDTAEKAKAKAETEPEPKE